MLCVITPGRLAESDVSKNRSACIYSHTDCLILETSRDLKFAKKPQRYENLERLKIFELFCEINR